MFKITCIKSSYKCLKGVFAMYIHSCIYSGFVSELDKEFLNMLFCRHGKIQATPTSIHHARETMIPSMSARLDSGSAGLLYIS